MILNHFQNEDHNFSGSCPGHGALPQAQVPHVQAGDQGGEAGSRAEGGEVGCC